MDRELRDAQRNISLLKRFDIKGNCFLDGGANVGHVSVAALDLGFKTVVAVEAHPETYKALRDSLRGRRANITTWQKAIAGNSDDTMFVSTPEHSTGATARRAMRLRGRIDYYRMAKTISLDDLIEAHGCDVIKLDIEGCEYEAIDAAKLPGVRWLIVEFHGTRSPKHYKQFLASKRHLLRLGFKMLHPKLIPMLDDGKAAKSFFFQTVFRRV